MLCFKMIFSCCLAVSCFSFASHPTKTVNVESQVFEPVTYDDIMSIFMRAEEDGLENYSEEQGERIFHLLVFLSRLGAFPGEDAERLEEDLKDMLEEDYDSYVCKVTLENFNMKVREILEGYP